MQRLDAKCMGFEKYDKRTYTGSIYRRDAAVPNDPYDFAKLDSAQKKTAKGTGKSALVSMAKQSKRNYVKMYEGSVGEAYANIRRENEKADYIKKLLM